MDKSFKVVLIVLIFSAMIFTGCKKKNKAPETPSIPAGPTNGSIDTKYTFASSAEDPDQDSITIRFDWGDEDTSVWSDWKASGDSVSMSHSWSDSGSYSIKTQAQDLKEAVSSWSGGYQIIIGKLNPPNTPEIPFGDTIGSVNVSYSFISTATDPDSDSIAIRFDWEDGDTSGWCDLKASGDSVSMSHSWSDTGTYNIKAQAKDKKGATSDWSTGHPIKISKGTWIKTFGDSDDDAGYSVQQTSDGGYIITGYTTTSDNDTNVYLIKTDASGNETWTNTFGGSSVDVGHSVQQTSDGGYIITGYTTTSDNDTNVYLIKTDASGNETWTNTFGGSSVDVGHSVQQTSDGGYIIAGYTRSPVTGTDDVYLIKTYPNGDSNWAKTFGDTLYYDAGYSVQQTSDGGYIITGYTSSYGAGGTDVYLIKTEENGNQQWDTTFGGSEYDVGYSVQQTFDGGYIIAGKTWSYGAGGYDVWLIKTTANGEYFFATPFGGPDEDYGYSVQQTLDGGYIITGYTKSYGAGGQDVYLIKTDEYGFKQWDKTFGGSADDAGYSIRRHYDSYIITGYTWSYGAGRQDVYLIKTDANGNVK